VRLDSVRDDFGSTALHWAALKGLAPMAASLLESGQAPNIKSGGSALCPLRSDPCD
jgi:ankyrin repeat protein